MALQLTTQDQESRALLIEPARYSHIKVGSFKLFKSAQGYGLTLLYTDLYINYFKYKLLCIL